MDKVLLLLLLLVALLALSVIDILPRGSSDASKISDKRA